MNTIKYQSQPVGEICQTEIVTKAFTVVAERYAGKIRKVNGSPYVAHLVAILLILRKQEPDILAASLLANILDDFPEYSYEQLSFDFNHDIAQLVKEMSETRMKVIRIQKNYQPRRSYQIRWRKRKKLFLSSFPSKSESAKLILTAKHIDNLLSLLRDYQNQGEAVWDKLQLNQKLMWRYYQDFFNVLTANFHHAIIGEYYSVFKEAEKVFSPSLSRSED